MSSKQKWKKAKLKYLADMRSGETITSDSIQPIGDYPVYGGGALRGYTSTYTHNGHYVLIGRQGAHCGNVKTVKGKLWASEHAVVVTPNSTTDIEWLGYLLESMNLNQYSMSAAQPGLAVSMIKNLEVLCPSREVQIEITNYISSKTSLIEDLILKKERLILLFEEKRQAMISEAVTKGLNPNVKMIDSGVEWIGEIPQHWKVKKIRRIVSEHKQGFYSSEEYNDNGVKLIRITDINKKSKVDITNSPRVNISDSEKKIFKVYKGDFLFARTGGAGNFGLIENNIEEAVFASYLIRFRFTNEMFIDFLKNYFISNAFKNGIYSSIHGGVNQNVHAEDIKNQIIVIPPFAEQKKIASILDREINDIDIIVDSITTQIQKLKEYRRSLIYEAVTGEIDVRDFKVVQ